MRIRSLLALFAAGFAVLPACAQLAPPNDAGVTMGHIHLFVKDVEAQMRFWTAEMGGIAVQNGPLSLIQFPGVFIMLRQAEPTAPPDGSIVNHFGFVWKDLPAALAKWKADGVEIEQTGNPNQGYVHAPDGIRVEFFGDPSLSVPVQMNHIHFYPVDIPAMQAWYARMFGGVPGKRARVSSPGWIDCDDVPGVNLSFSQGKTALAPTKGRSLDHIGFDVKDLDAFAKKLEANGIKLDEAIRQLPNSKTKVAFLTDPWGTRLELTEGLAPDSPPNPYRTVENWAKLPEGRTWGQVISADIDRDGKSIWVVERCGGTSCAGSNLAPILKFDSSGNLLKSFGEGMFVRPHGLFVDKSDNVWVTDGEGKDGKGHQVFKFSSNGKVLMTLGKAGIAGDGPDSFNKPSDVLIAPNGDIFVADGHGEGSNARIVKFSADGKFIKSWGKQGKGPGEFDFPHSLAMDSKGRLFVADRNNSRIQIFDQDGKFLDEWRQFGRPSGIYIDKNDVLYSTDSESNSSRNPGVKRGIRIGSVKDGKVVAFIPDPVLNPGQGLEPGNGTAAEGVAADDAGNVYGAEVGPRSFKRYVKK
jgi:catechol 2,3-dioxygenase-like lactoylglutathione lyase family enzyme